MFSIKSIFFYRRAAVKKAPHLLKRLNVTYKMRPIQWLEILNNWSI